MMTVEPVSAISRMSLSTAWEDPGSRLRWLVEEQEVGARA